MPLDLDAVMALRDEGRRFTYGDRDTMLYNLAVGFGRDPLDARELPFVFEGDGGPRTLPTMAVTLTRSDLPRRLPINYAMMLHGEQTLTVHRPLPSGGELLADTRVTQVVDKGEGKGALITYQTTARAADGGEPLYTTGGVLFARGDGGFGDGAAQPAPRPHAVPDRAPDITYEARTEPGQALLYRLTGDRNPLHADPAAAAKASFRAPILHGLASYGTACRALAAAACGYDAARIRSFDARFTSPVFPGETLSTEIWIDGDVASFRCTVAERGVVALNNGRAQLS